MAGWQAAYRGLVPDGYLDGMQVDPGRRRARMTGPAAPPPGLAADDGQG